MNPVKANCGVGGVAVCAEAPIAQSRDNPRPSAVNVSVIALATLDCIPILLNSSGW
jgi:hypothetical protein